MHYEQFADGTVKCIEDEIPFEVPENWEWCRLLPLTIKIGAGSTPTGGAAVYSDNGVKFIRSQNVYDDGLLLDDVAYISEEINFKKSSSIVKPKDILLNITGGSIGRCGLIPDEFDIGNVNQHVIIIRLVDLQLRHYMHSVITSSYIQSLIHKRQVGSGRGGLSAETLSTFLIPLPPVAEQYAIQNKKKALLDLVSCISKDKTVTSELICQAKAKILDLAIRGKLVPQDPNDEPASALVERIRTEKEKLIKEGKIKRDKKESFIFKGEDNSYYENVRNSVRVIDSEIPFAIPDSWQWCKLGTLCDYGNCISVSNTQISEYDWVLDLEDIEKNTGVVLKRCTKAERPFDSIKHRFGVGQVLYSKLRPYLNKVVLADSDGYCTSEIIPLTFASSVIPEYARYLLMSPYFLAYADQCSYGVKMPRLSSTDAKRAFFPLPPVNEQQRIVNVVKKIFARIEEISASLS